MGKNNHVPLCSDQDVPMLDKRLSTIVCAVLFLLVSLNKSYSNHHLSTEFRDALLAALADEERPTRDSDECFLRLELAAETQTDHELIREMVRLHELNEQSAELAQSVANTKCSGTCDEWRQAVADEQTRNRERQVLTTSVRAELGMPPI